MRPILSLFLSFGYCWIFLILFSSGLSAQTFKVDSLMHTFESIQNDSLRLDSLSKALKKYESTSYQAAKAIGQEMVRLGNDLGEKMQAADDQQR